MVKSLSLFLVFVLFFFYSCVSVSVNDKHTEGGDKQNIDLYNYNIEEKIQELGFLLPEPGSPVANYVSTVSFSETKHHDWSMFQERALKKVRVDI